MKKLWGAIFDLGIWAERHLPTRLRTLVFLRITAPAMDRLYQGDKTNG